MKNLVRSFFICVVVFSYTHADEKYFNQLHKDEVSRLNYLISYFKTKIPKSDTKKTSQASKSLEIHKKELQTLKSLENNQKKLYKHLANKKQKWYQRAIRAKEEQLKKSSSYSSYYKNHIAMFKKGLENLKIKSKYINTIAQVKNIKTTELKLSTANKAKTTINSSNLSTIVKMDNVNISNKAKASVGSVSIGKD
ncbi:hypothetical protein [Sulfurimonas sp.]